jgi:hypothetical protein
MNSKFLSAIVFFSLFLISPTYAIDIAGFSISNTTTAADFIVYLFNLGIMIGGVLAAIVLVMSGIDYMTSSGDPGKIEQTKKRIQNSVVGIIVLLSSYLILNTINSDLTKVALYQLPTQVNEPIVIPPDKGVYLYESNGNGMLLTKTSTLIPDGFKTQSIKFVNPDDFQFGAVLFNNGDLEGSCSWVTSDLNSISASSGQQNNPAINKLSSVYLFKMQGSSPSVTFYNNIDCVEQSKEYGDKYPGKKGSCMVSGTMTNRNISEACPDFAGTVVSMIIDGEGGVILKDSSKEAYGRCQFFPRPVYSSCVNVIKDSFVYNPDFAKGYSPKSFTILPMIIESVVKPDPIIQ